MNRRKHGFSLIEILITVAVVAIALLGVIAALTFGVRSADHAERMTEATHHARRLIGLIRSQGMAANGAVWDNLDPNLDDAEGTRRELNQTPFDGQMPEGTNMRRNVQITQGLGGDMDDVARIRVRVFWTIRGEEKKVEIVGFQRRGS
ncbi:MAG: prepilin-type N-terminal cleavage/methylation domain-containing protein [Armatimonadetes bacterium]|nr:prepilin-type N-terminal cleavage/methylation domain-containing protein [Armatimonadota bacterium]